MPADSKEAAFQNDILNAMCSPEGGWVRGEASKYDRARALYAEDAIAYVRNTQPEAWEAFAKLNPPDPESAYLDRVAAQLAKADPNATDKALRAFGTLGVLRQGIKDRSVRFSLCQFAPEHGLNPETKARYEGNICRVVPEVVYSPWATAEELAATGAKAKAWRIDLVLFVNGLPVATMELKSAFKQAVDNAVKQYRDTRLPKDPATNKPEPLLTFKRGALVHFAVSQYEAYMTTRLAGAKTRFLPFNKGTKEGGAGNPTPDNEQVYATSYLWRDVLAPASLLQILGRFMHLEVKEEED